VTYTVDSQDDVIFTWTFPADWVILSGQGNDTITVTVGSLNGTITVAASNSCGTAPDQVLSVIAQTGPAQPATVFGLQFPCANSVQIYSVTGIAGDTYNWSLPAGWYIISGQGTDSVTVHVGTQFGPVTVVPSNACGVGTSNYLPVAPIVVIDPEITSSGDTLYSSYMTGNQWYDSNGPIAGATNYYYVPPVAGVYYVVYVDLYGCMGTSLPFNFDFIGIVEYDSDWSIYPNPVSDVLFIDINAPDGSKVSVKLYDVIGQLLVSKIANDHELIKIDMDVYPDGAYFVTVDYKGRSMIKKLILNKN
jgi:hypothetical protein